MSQIESERILQLLVQKHRAEEWARFAELRGATGFVDMRRIDLFVMHLWPSKKHRSIAYEIKVSRADFDNELRNPKKRALAEQIAHECYFVVPNRLIGSDETPQHWGLIYANAGGLRTVKKAQQRASVTWPPAFVASLARRASDPPARPAIQAWRVAGQDVTEEQLLEIAAETVGRHIESERARIRREGEKAITESEHYKTQGRIVREIAAMLGTYAGDHRLLDKLRAFRAGQEAITPAGRRLIREAIYKLEQSLKEIPTAQTEEITAT